MTKIIWTADYHAHSMGINTDLVPVFFVITTSTLLMRHSTSTFALANHVFMELALCTGARTSNFGKTHLGKTHILYGCEGVCSWLASQ